MFSPNEYELLDFGAGRKLERFAGIVLDRPAPAGAWEEPAHPDIWTAIHARFERTKGHRGKWRTARQCPDTWTVRHDTMVLELKRAGSGALGIYPEQSPNWDWLARQVRHAAPPVTVLNLFAYTGGSTLTAAAAGAQVTHVDAARGVVNWARRCARQSHLQEAPIRWIVDDAMRFAQREVRRGKTYTGLILDPPTYGHGPTGQEWKIDRDLPPLLQVCKQLLCPQPLFFLLSCHAPSTGPADLEALAAEHVLGGCQSGVRARRLYLSTRRGRSLNCGVVAHWPA